ncbi:transposase [Burkholderia sp. L27(2015)]|uniref:transposase n=1 Tax=Burkholderia sp. L27(2015) TaxID=1641858 RepID=UPI00349EAD7B
MYQRTSRCRGNEKEKRAACISVRSVRSVLEHPFRVIKLQFGFAKVRYRGLKKNTAQLTKLFALSNL